MKVDIKTKIQSSLYGFAIGDAVSRLYHHQNDCGYQRSARICILQNTGDYYLFVNDATAGLGAGRGFGSKYTLTFC